MAYEALASAYDALTYDIAYDDALRFMQQLLAEAGLHPETVVDLACGTGSLSVRLAAQGYRVYGVDLSEEMLTQAAQKAAALSGQPPLFLCQSMPQLRLLEPVDAAISTLDSLNYLTRERDLRQTFARVYRWLRPGGRFYFDVNTPWKLQRMDGQIYMDETEESVCVWRTFFSEKTRVCTYQVDLFSQRPDGAWDREFEEHRERAWSREELEQFLTEAGFRDITVSGDLTTCPPREDEDRWIITAVRPAEDAGKTAVRRTGKQ